MFTYLTSIRIIFVAKSLQNFRACLGDFFFQILFFRIQILLKFYLTFSNFVSGFLNHPSIISKNKFHRYSQF
jgi:hypothetical protein